jgi:hypothetical protein
MDANRPAERERELQNEIIELIESALRTERLLGQAIGEREAVRVGSEGDRVLACLIARLIANVERLATPAKQEGKSP